MVLESCESAHGYSGSQVAVLLTLELASASPGGLVRTDSWALPPRF